MSLRQKKFDSYHVNFQSGAGVDVCVNCVVGSTLKEIRIVGNILIVELRKRLIKRIWHRNQQ